MTWCAPNIIFQIYSYTNISKMGPDSKVQGEYAAHLGRVGPR